MNGFNANGNGRRARWQPRGAILALDQLLYDFGRTEAAVRRAEGQLEAARERPRGACSRIRPSTQMITQVSRLMTILLTVIASISLVVGGIGIMNIMLVSVAERTREIGLRMAVGARGRDMLFQFLAESMMLSAVGGIIGVGLGALAAQTIAGANHWPVLVSARSIAIALVFSAGVGIFFGFYPAWRASRLNPIESLRHE